MNNALGRPYLFENTLNGNEYHRFLSDDLLWFLEDLLLQLRKERKILWYMQNGTLARRARGHY